MKVGLCDIHAVCEHTLHIDFWIPEPIFKKLGMYTVGSKPIWACFINPSLQSVCLYVYPLIIARQRFGKTLPLRRIHMQQMKNCWRNHFLCGPYRTKGKYVIGSSQNLLFFYSEGNAVHWQNGRWDASCKSRGCLGPKWLFPQFFQLILRILLVMNVTNKLYFFR
jgi:hypothetical protein